jgi:hypothetical protein
VVLRPLWMLKGSSGMRQVIVFSAGGCPCQKAGQVPGLRPAGADTFGQPNNKHNL